MPRPDRFTPGNDLVPIVLGGLQDRSKRVRKISSPPGFDPRTVQPVANRYTDYAIPDHSLLHNITERADGRMLMNCTDASVYQGCLPRSLPCDNEEKNKQSLSQQPSEFQPTGKIIILCSVVPPTNARTLHLWQLKEEKSDGTNRKH